MIIGLDFDNTIVNYDGVFHSAAVELGLIDQDIAKTKLAVRADLRARDMEDDWTALQGYVYGKCMDRAAFYESALQVMSHLLDSGMECKIISHKTRFPYKGPQYDLHEAASKWINDHLVDENGTALLTVNDISFHETKEQKVARIAQEGCTYFLDDLPEILLHDIFPENTKSVLFDPDNMHEDNQILRRVDTWKAFGDLLTQ